MFQRCHMPDEPCWGQTDGAADFSKSTGAGPCAELLLAPLALPEPDEEMVRSVGMLSHGSSFCLRTALAELCGPAHQHPGCKGTTNQAGSRGRASRGKSSCLPCHSAGASILQRVRRCSAPGAELAPPRPGSVEMGVEDAHLVSGFKIVLSTARRLELGS